MANEPPVKSSVAIRMDRMRHLRFDFRARSEFRARMGYSIASVFDRLVEVENALKDKTLKEKIELGGRMQMDAIGDRDLHALVWAGLLHEDPDLRFETVPDLMEQLEAEREELGAEERSSIFLNAVWDAWIASKSIVVQKKMKALEEEAKRLIESARRNGTTSDGSVMASSESPSMTASGASPQGS